MNISLSETLLHTVWLKKKCCFESAECVNRQIILINFDIFENLVLIQANLFSSQLQQILN